MYDLKRLGANIKFLRKAHGETQSELGAAINVEKNTISNYENGKREPDEATLTSIAKHFMFTVEELIHLDFSGIGSIKLDTKAFIRNLDIVLPIISSDKAMNNESFCKAYKAHKRMYECFKNEELDDLDFIDDCFDNYEKAEEDDDAKIEAVGNIIALLYFTLLSLTIPALFSKPTAIVLQLAKNDSDVQKAIQNRDPDFEKGAEEILAEIHGSEEFNEEMNKHRLVLKQSTKWTELADYYLALQYVWGIVDNDLTFEFNRRIGSEMLDLIAVIDNGHHVLRVVFAEDKRLRVAFGRERECERSRDLRIVRHDRLGRIPINIRAENRNLPGCQHFKVIYLAGLDVALREHVNASGRIVDFDVA